MASNEMVSSNDFKTGLTIEYEGNIYQIMEFQHVKPGKGQAFIRSKLRNLRTGSVTDFAFQTGIKIAKAIIEKKVMQYLYNDGETYSFMDMESFEQIDIPAERLTTEKNYLLEGMNVTIIDYQGEILGVNLPEKMALEVIECDPGIRGNTVANTRKNATLETGFKIQVPLFINAGDKVIVNTFTGEYDSRA